jgi:TonB family protein
MRAFVSCVAALALVCELAAQEPGTPPVSTANSTQPSKPVRVGTVIMSPTLLKRVEPVYPESALAARVEGTVLLEVRIDAAGQVTEAKVLRAPRPMGARIPAARLEQAAIDAVKQWVYEPVVLSGTPTAAILVASVTFRLPARRPPASIPSR